MFGATAKRAVITGGATEARRPAPVHISGAACLRGGKTYVPCITCADNCPIDAITFAGRSAAVAESCLGCGACSATCPVGAIAVDGFDEPPEVGAHLNIECARVPARRLETETWVVPCVAGLRVSDVVAAAERQGDADVSVVFVDRGLCESCPASRGDNTIAAAHARFSTLFERIAPDAIRLERSERPIAVGEARPAGFRPATSRRAFLRTLIKPALAAKRPIGAPEDRAAMERLAGAAGRALDASFYPTVTISSACRDHGVCTASCPNGALRREMSGEADHIRRIMFDPAQCLACGRCAEVCPEHALTFAAAGAAQMQCEPVVLRETHLPVCPQCEEAFVAEDGESDLCPACRKSQSLFADLFAATRGPARMPGADISDGTV